MGGEYYDLRFWLNKEPLHRVCFIRQMCLAGAQFLQPSFLLVDPMISTFRSLMLTLAMLAMGTAQVLGVQAGYLCGCTGQKSTVETCHADTCHPMQDHEHEADADSPCGCPEENEPSPADHDHKHQQAHDTLLVTGFPPLSQLPAPVLLDSLSAYLVPEFAFLTTALWQAIECPDPPEHGCPPMPQLVARTMVMLV